MTNIQSIGFIGLGVMGGPMCANVVKKSKLPVWGLDRDAQAAAALSAPNFHAARDLAQLTREVDVVLLSLPSIVQVAEVCEAIYASPGRIKCIVDMSTSAVRQTRELAQKAQQLGIVYLDAPVARLREAARTGTLSIMVGGPREDFDMIQPILAYMGSDITYCGSVGNGQVVKILNNMAVFMTVHTLAEALTIGRRAGVDPELLFQTMALGSSDSFVLRNVGLKYLVKDHFPTQTFPTEYAIKDISLALELARDGEVCASLAQTTRALLERTRDAGFAKEYYPIMVRVIEAESRQAAETAARANKVN
jgi:3-hydroxyisobutyrate dehydrogenase-like beta-hydroxyacid dehydrogenase